MTTQLETQVAEYSRWREELRGGIEAYHNWLDSHGHVDIQRSLRLYDLAESLHSDRMVLAFLVLPRSPSRRVFASKKPMPWAC